MERQNAMLDAWLARHAPAGIASMADHIGDLLVENAAVTRAEPGAVWILRSLRLAATRPCPARIAPACRRPARRCRHSPSRPDRPRNPVAARSEEHTSELQSLMRNSYAV